MKPLVKFGVAAAALMGAATLASAPASADGFSFSIGVPGIGFSYDSGGYCDQWGCPDEYWDLPVYYGPVYWGGEWYQGPVYYRRHNGRYYYWIHGGWRRDEWRGPHPHWWRGHYAYGPSLGYEFYRGHGFRHDRDHHWRGDHWRRGMPWRRDHDRHDGHHDGHGDHHGGDRHDGDHHGDHGGDHHGDHGGDHHGDHGGDHHGDHDHGDHHGHHH